ncbi:methyl-accepting chemotaxis protein [Thermodesulfobacteriota bacterium]
MFDKIRNIKIGTKLLITFLVIGFIPFFLIGIIAVTIGSNAISEQVSEKLQVVQQIKKAQIEEFFKDRASHIGVLSTNALVLEAVKNYRFAIDNGELNLEGYEYYNEMYGESLAKFKDAFGYYDILLITENGDIVYSAKVEGDLTQNVVTGGLKDSPIGGLFQKAVKGISIQDFEVYAPSNNKYISFVGAPLLGVDDNTGEKTLLGVVVLKMDKTPINTIVQRREGMGDTGESYLVGKHEGKISLRSDLTTLGEKNDIYKMGYEYSTPYIEKALSGESGEGNFESDSGELTISYDPLDLGDMNWAIISKIETAEANNAVNTLKILMLVIAVIGFIVILGIGIILPRSIIRPINKVVARIKDIAEGEGDLTLRLDEISRDEVGALARWFNTFIEKLQAMIRSVAENAENLNNSSTDLSSISTQMSDGTDQMSTKSNSVAAASHEMSSNMESVAAAMEEASTNMSMVASAAEQMTATINEIAQNSEKARSITGDAVNQAQNTSQRVGELGRAAVEINKVTEAITEISAQTNLLALNATIEAARAGEAGKGFAVVANEIKELAKQTADATQEIKDRIGGIQDSTSGTVTEIEQILGIISNVNEIVSTIATAVEEQSVTTKEIASNVAQASQGISEVNQKVAQSNSVATDINREISEVNQATNEMSNSSSQINLSARELSDLAEQLKEMVNRFKV